MNIYKTALYTNLHFDTVKGTVNLQDVANMPLTSKNGYDLDTLWKSLKSELNAGAEESRVTAPQQTKAQQVNKLRYDIVDDIITDRLEQIKLAALAKEKAAEKAELLALLADKENEAKRQLSADEIKARLAAL